jgi:ubiquinone/menaquinone biosynthesis C-methylase UbiE
LELFDSIGKDYNHARHADVDILDRFIDLLQANKNDRYLEVGSGTGNYTIAMSEKGYKVTGVDPSHIMSRTAIEKDERKSIFWSKGYAEKLPFHDGLFSGVFSIHTLHHFKNIKKAFGEIYRVLNKGRFVIFTNSREQIDKYWLKEYFPDAIYKLKAIMPDISSVKDHLRRIGFTNIETEIFKIKDNLMDGFLGSNKDKPEMYLDPDFRKGISIFWKINEKKINDGCKRLKEDISAKKTEDIIYNYEKNFGNLGEYLFIICEKK